MTKHDAVNLYFGWLTDKIRRPGDRRSYTRLLRLLYDTDYRYRLPLDGNREADGIDLRYRFGDELGVRQYAVARYLDDRPCSVLEMMIALALRCEESIMEDPDKGDRTWMWFWAMAKSLGLDGLCDVIFDQSYAEDVLTIFMEQAYEANGRGGLFYIRCPYRDMRTVDIWTQMNWWLEAETKEGRL